LYLHRPHTGITVDVYRYVTLCIGRYRWPTSVASSRSRRGDDVAHSFKRSVTVPVAIASVGKRRWAGGVSGTGVLRLRARHSKESRRVRRPYLFKHRRHRHPSAAANHLQHPAPPAIHFGYCVTCVCQVRLPPCLCIIDVLSNGRNKREKNTHTYTRPLRHSHRRRCYNIASLHSAHGIALIVSASRLPVFAAHITHTRRS
jgi:hypothetical protein